MQIAPVTVTRTIQLPTSPDDVWSSLCDAEGLTGWLGDAVDLVEVAAGAAGTVTDGETVRRLVVTSVGAGRSIGFVWWDEGHPAEASVVTIDLAASEDGAGTTVTLT